MFFLAEKLGRTVGELMWGSEVFRPLSASELTEWIAHEGLRQAEHDAALAKAKSRA